jgi:hypothetical protein
MGSSSESQSALRLLAERLLVEQYPGAATRVELHPRIIPPEYTGSIPLPVGGKLLGSATFRRDGGILRVDAAVEIEKPTATALREYETQLRGQGWVPFGYHMGGFSPGLPRSFRRKQGGPALLVNATDNGKQATGFRLQLNWEMARHMPHRPHDAMDLLPSLIAPPDVEMEGGGASGNENSWSSSGTAHTDMPVGELGEYFEQQLQVANWTRLAGATAGQVAWSTWKLPELQPWLGLLLVAALERGERQLMIHLQSTGRRSRGHWAPAPRGRWHRRPWWRRLSIRI